MLAKRSWIIAVLLGTSLVLSGCESAPIGMGCNDDRDCPAGQRCGSGGCTALDDSGSRDGGTQDAGGADVGRSCSSDPSCDDHVFCNGMERCITGACVTGTPPCDSASCDESADRCHTVVVDHDGDGDPSTTDCDDDDPTRFTGNLQEMNRCDNVDNDCNPGTLGPDTDGDTFSARGCCNPQPDGSMACGTDCNDAQATVNPSANEAPCNGADDNCNGQTDEGVLPTYYVDADGDHYGSSDPGAPSMMGCTMPPSYAANNLDCNDSNPNVYPMHTELCGGTTGDDDCDMSVDEGCACPISYQTRPCCGGRGTQTCNPASGGWDWDACTAPTIAELCNGVDDDCDTTVDEEVVPPAPPPGLASPQCYTGTAGLAPDGTPIGVCRTGTYACAGSSGWSCGGEITPQSSMAVQCNADLDCDGNAFENVVCTPSGPPTACYACSGDRPIPGTATCSSACSLNACNTPSGVIYDQMAPNTDPWIQMYAESSSFCGRGTGTSSNYVAIYQQDQCGIVQGPYLDLPPGMYTARVFLDAIAPNPGTARVSILSGASTVITSATAAVGPFGSTVHTIPTLTFTLTQCNNDVRVAVGNDLQCYGCGSGCGFCVGGNFEIRRIQITRL